MYILEDFIAEPRRLRTVSNYDIVTKYADEAVKKDMIAEYLSLLDKHTNWGIKALVLGNKNSVYAIKELFRDQLECLMSEPRYEYGSQTLVQVFTDIDRMYANGTILKSEYKKKYLYRAADTLSKDDYRVFALVMKQEFSPAIMEYMELNCELESVKSKMLSQFKSFKWNCENLFNNNTNSVNVYFPVGRLRYYLRYNGITIGIDKDYNKDANDVSYNYHSKVALIDVCDDTGPIFCITRNNGVCTTLELEKRTERVSEHVFGMKLCSGLQSVLFVSDDKEQVISYASFENNVLKHEVKKADSFSVNVLPYCNFSASIITANTQEGPFYIFAKTEDANKLGKNTKYFKVIEMNGKYFLEPKE